MSFGLEITNKQTNKGIHAICVHRVQYTTQQESSCASDKVEAHDHLICQERGEEGIQLSKIAVCIRK